MSEEVVVVGVADGQQGHSVRKILRGRARKEEVGLCEAAEGKRIGLAKVEIQRLEI